jgi:thiol-disulfide isomerase/thioredoxin
MASFRKRRLFWAGLSLVVFLGLLGFSARGRLFRLIARNEGGELGDIREEWRGALEARYDAREAAKSPSEADQAQNEFSQKERRFVERCLAFAKAHAGTADELRALKLVACRSPNSKEGEYAAGTLAKSAASADLGMLATAIAFPTGTSQRPVKMLGPILLERIKKASDDPQAARLLASVVCPLAVADQEGTGPSTLFAAAADLIVERYADSPDIHNFCEIVGMRVGRPRWGGLFEKHLRTILKHNHDRKVRVAASFALASVVQASGESRQLEAEKLYQEFVDQFDGSVHYTEDGKWYGYAGIEKDLNTAAKQQLAELRSRALGMPAPEIDALDLDGRPMKLSEYQGKVVLLDFWATSCAPCMRMIPDEQELAERLKDKPFAIVGVNSDADEAKAQSAAKKHGITWRSFRDNIGKDRTISGDWQNIASPTLYLIDQKGIIRKRWIGGPPWDELSQAVDRLVGLSEETTRTVTK